MPQKTPFLAVLLAMLACADDTPPSNYDVPSRDGSRTPAIVSSGVDWLSPSAFLEESNPYILRSQIDASFLETLQSQNDLGVVGDAMRAELLLYLGREDEARAVIEAMDPELCDEWPRSSIVNITYLCDGKRSIIIRSMLQDLDLPVWNACYDQIGDSRSYSYEIAARIAYRLGIAELDDSPIQELDLFLLSRRVFDDGVSPSARHLNELKKDELLMVEGILLRTRDRSDPLEPLAEAYPPIVQHYLYRFIQAERADDPVTSQAYAEGITPMIGALDRACTPVPMEVLRRHASGTIKSRAPLADFPTPDAVQP